MNRIYLDFNKTTGVMKALHGVNNSPIVLNGTIPTIKEAGIPFVRLHDTGGTYGGSHYVDIPNVFPDFDADADDPASYDFSFTDAYIKSLVDSGTEVFYRLGVTIENNYKIKAYRIHPPKDPFKWANICSGIIRHYNEGWADGYRYNIRYWEIWNEPDNDCMWSGTPEEYYQLYRITAVYLKQCFPSIQIGGFASCGYYAITRKPKNPRNDSFLTFFEDFLKYISKPETAAPLDFFSWHLYTDDPEEISVHAAYADAKLKEYGFTHTESIFDEWNRCNGAPDLFDEMKTMLGASFVASALCKMQYLPIDKAMYYDAFPARRYCGLYTFPGFKVTKTYYAFQAFNELYRLKTAVQATSEIKNLSVAAATGCDGAAVLISSYGCSENQISLALQNLPNGAKSAEIILLNEKNDLALVKTETLSGNTANLTFTMEPYLVVLIKIKCQ